MNKILENTISFSELDSATKLSCYGLSIGISVDFELLKLELNFEAGTLDFFIEYGPVYWICALAFGDIAIEYIISKLK